MGWFPATVFGSPSGDRPGAVFWVLDGPEAPAWPAGLGVSRGAGSTLWLSRPNSTARRPGSTAAVIHRQTEPVAGFGGPPTGVSPAAGGSSAGPGTGVPEEPVGVTGLLRSRGGTEAPLTLVGAGDGDIGTLAEDLPSPPSVGEGGLLPVAGRRPAGADPIPGLAAARSIPGPPAVGHISPPPGVGLGLPSSDCGPGVVTGAGGGPRPSLPKPNPPTSEPTTSAPALAVSAIEPAQAIARRRSIAAPLRTP
ncbi:MAG: hypothetical protein ACRDQZ_14580 [Mycobacteriales bacterium]